jgi:hypothetical protein
VYKIRGRVLFYFDIQSTGQKSQVMVITKIVTTLPEQYRYFSTAWDSVSENLKTIENNM